ncbi:hypothetical protein SAMN04487948_1326 [Halogranum amylolyticum]|uniref:Uncharacterized protein n=1 Tax=Halogranum amylolyticum TaxID=660520 RepID=A0A1H8WK86_9EURY|nr:hypothetical protein [Halogranum amylolyticum]SEP27999.1 hypothetical protein SAMN04487948_1326 [Halogranum amylolyticum]
MRARTPVVALGVLVFALALGVLVTPELGGSIPVGEAVDAAGSDYKLFVVFGAAALAVVFVVFALRAVGGQNQATPPDPEDIRTAPVPGAGFDAVLTDGVGLRERLFGDAHEQVRGRLRETATQTVMRRENCGRKTARESVETGSWTDDRDAAAFVGGAEGPSPPLSSRVSAALRGRSWFQHGARRAAEEIVAGDGPETGDDTRHATDGGRAVERGEIELSGGTELSGDIERSRRTEGDR